jgi:Lrp/AsnC family transcriptional regulator, leucine-responsive regulatory protein
MDEIDKNLLRLLQIDNRRSSADLAEEIGLSVSATSDRVRRLNAAGAIIANRAILNAGEVGFKLCAFIFVDLEPRADEIAFAETVCGIPEVQEAHHITGQHSWLIKVRVADPAELQNLLVNNLKIIPGVLKTETIIALHTAKETTEMPFPKTISLEDDP